MRERAGKPTLEHERKRIPAVPKSKAAQRSKSFYVKGRTLKAVLIAWYVARRDRIVVSTLRCGRSNLGSNPSHGTASVLREASGFFFLQHGYGLHWVLQHVTAHSIQKENYEGVFTEQDAQVINEQVFDVK